MSFRPLPGRAARDADERMFLGDHVVPNIFVKLNDIFDYTDFKTKQVFSMGET